MNEGIHLDLDTWIVPGQIRKANLCRGLGNRYTPAGTENPTKAAPLTLPSTVKPPDLEPKPKAFEIMIIRRLLLSFYGISE